MEPSGLGDVVAIPTGHDPVNTYSDELSTLDKQALTPKCRDGISSNMTLNDWFHAKQKPQWWLARELGVTQAAVSRILTGQRRPSWRLMARIMEVTDGAVRPEDFLHPKTDGKPHPKRRACARVAA